MNYGKLTDAERAAHNAQVLSTVTVIQSHIDAYKPALKAWRAEYGSKPTDQMLMVGHLLFNKHQKPGGVEAFGGAMLLRPEGCVSGSEYQLAAVPLTGKSVGPMNNKRKAVVLGKLFHETSAGKPARYWLTFMPAGEKALAVFNAAHVAAVTPNKAQTPEIKAKAKKANKVLNRAKQKAEVRASHETAEQVAAVIAEAAAVEPVATIADIAAAHDEVTAAEGSNS